LSLEAVSEEIIALITFGKGTITFSNDIPLEDPVHNNPLL